ncbi:hypothetical protein [Gloeothece verrucosa]|uniref:Uncharacterized protein n=1 Tax=Gloeothece verrucosa (strain PCC 7822) TaxID=497965 RepID=E0UCV3_GLOV7|nr:hypothetical protein [Gloeothece verrucosa]ADN16418.1 hypothetical protein Cyan7822_4508 [Gloeothece verrucosa PCC 7822]
MGQKDLLNLIGECAQLARAKGIKNVSVILNQRYSLPYLSMLTHQQLIDFQKWLEETYEQ